MKQKKKNTMHFPFLVFAVFLGALLIRVLLIHWTLDYGNNGDFTRYEDWARVAHTYNFATTYAGTYSQTVANNEPPGTLYVLSATYETYILEGRAIAKATHTIPGSLLWVNTFLQHATMKIPPLLTDFLSAIVIYLIVTKVVGKKRGIFAAGLFLFNPIVIYNSAIWGQMDSINNFFLLLSLFFALRKNIFLSLFSFAISLYIKLSLLPLLPFYLVFLYFISGKKAMRISLEALASIALIIIATFPVSSQPLLWLIQNIPPLSGGELQNVTNSAFNFWMAAACIPIFCDGHNIPLVNQIFLWISLNAWGYILFGLFTLPMLFLQIKQNQKFILPKNIFLVLSLVALCTFLFLPKMHDRYMYPVFPLFAAAIGISNKYKAYMVIYCILSLFHLDNLVYSWNPIVFSSTTTFYHIFYGPVLRWILSILTVFVGGWWYLKSFREWGIKP